MTGQAQLAVYIVYSGICEILRENTCKNQQYPIETKMSNISAFIRYTHFSIQWRNHTYKSTISYSTYDVLARTHEHFFQLNENIRLLKWNTIQVLKMACNQKRFHVLISAQYFQDNIKVYTRNGWMDGSYNVLGSAERANLRSNEATE